jgi:hypothetical protein
MANNNGYAPRGSGPVTFELPDAPLDADNLGYQVTTRDYSWLSFCTIAWGDEFHQPDHGIYEFSNSRKFDSTDQYATGVYKKYDISADGIWLQSPWPDARAFLTLQQGGKLLIEQ